MLVWEFESVDGSSLEYLVRFQRTLNPFIVPFANMDVNLNALGPLILR